MFDHLQKKPLAQGMLESEKKDSTCPDLVQPYVLRMKNYRQCSIAEIAWIQGHSDLGPNTYSAINSLCDLSQVSSPL